MKWLPILLLLAVAACAPDVDPNAPVEEPPAHPDPEIVETYDDGPDVIPEEIDPAEVEQMPTEALAPVENSNEKRLVTLLGVSGSADKCLIKVGDEQGWVDEGMTRKINGVTIHVFDAILIHGFDADACEAYIGGDTITLRSR